MGIRERYERLCTVWRRLNRLYLPLVHLALVIPLLAVLWLFTESPRWSLIPLVLIIPVAIGFQVWAIILEPDRYPWSSEIDE